MRAKFVIATLTMLTASFESANAETGYTCFRNATENTLYVSVRFFTGGNTNFTLGPGQKHRLNNTDSRDLYCIDNELYTNACPRMAFLPINNQSICDWNP